MSNEPSTNTDQKSEIPPVEMEGCYGTVVWTPPTQLYAMMPRANRDDLLEYTGAKQVSPHLVDLTERTLNHLNCPIAAGDLDPSYSLESREIECEHIGKLVWMAGQGAWDTLPVDKNQRNMIFAMIMADLHPFMLYEIVVPLANYSTQQFGRR